MQRSTTVLGVALIALFAFLPLVTVVIDSTPPQATYYTPDDLGVYRDLSVLEVWCKDDESGIDRAVCVIDGSSYTLSYARTEYGWYIYQAAAPQLAEGSHTVQWSVYNKAGGVTQKSGSFTIYGALNGDWYVLNTKVASPTQVLYTSSPTIDFKFVKTDGAPDYMIAAWVEEGGSKILTLSNTATSTWTGSYTFTAGTHSLKLVASDSDSSVVFSIVQLDLGGGPRIPEWLNFRNSLLIAGVVLLVVGWARRE